jgi:tetratricopeptide (TPR) repeat protein
MTRPQDAPGTPLQPPLAELVRVYLRRQAALEAHDPMIVETGEEVMPFDAAAAPAFEPRRGWEEARAAARLLGREEVGAWPMPPDWLTLGATYEPPLAIAIALGNSPQMMRNPQPLLGAGRLAELRPQSGHSLPAPGPWAGQQFGQQVSNPMLLALALLRLARQFDLAADLIEKHQSSVPAEWQSLWANEVAALAWHRGEAAQALNLWEAQPASVPVLFNRGMAYLFDDRPADAKPALTEAVRQLPENDAWHHLGCLYLALADVRS